jgi:hypothetical protein
MAKPAKQEDDHKLFDHLPPAVRKLNAQARKELREQERNNYAAKHGLDQSRNRADR